MWVDDPNAIFRRGVVACISAADYSIAGESSHLEPEPRLEDVDILLFDLDGGPTLQQVLRLSRAEQARP